MSLYAIGDLHLSFTANKPMDVFGREWKDHVRKIEKNWRGRIGAEDTVVITGDHSWGRNLEEALADLDFIQSLPGRKILLRGNHDMFWDAKKTYRLNEMFQGRLSFFRIIIMPTRNTPWWGQRGTAMRERIHRNILRSW